MKKIVILFVVIFSFDISYSQVGNSPYPIIFVHGLNSDDHTWDNTLSLLSLTWNLNTNHTFHAVINARGGDTTNYPDDVIISLKDISGNIVNTVSNSSIYTINFGNFWNRNSSDPRLILYNNSAPGSNQSTSNQSAIFKQAYVLKIFIDSVLRITEASKIILVGHSMGGLAIREYLQRKENGIHKWWINPNDSINGHKVARVVTTGTPHLGTNVMSSAFFTIDNNSEAMRDLKYSYPSGDNGSYLFGNPETYVPAGYYNKDINCNGVVSDTIVGLNSNSNDNPILPLPRSILYTWITSNYLGLGTDGVVPLSRQLLYDSAVVPHGIADTLLTNKNHLQETGDARSLIRGLDEPDNKEFAYNISFGKLYSGFITLQANGLTSDSDFYKIQIISVGKIAVKLKSLNSGVNNISILSDIGNILVSKNLTGPEDSISFHGDQSNYYIRIIGNSNQNPNQNPFSFTANFIPVSSLNLTMGIEGMWNGSSHVPDTVKVFLRNSIAPYNGIDSAIVYLNSSGNVISYFIHASAGNYYIQITHRNALETWSSSAVNFRNGITTVYDFTNSQSQAFGNNQLLKLGKWCIYSGDVNQDGVVDGTDGAIIDNDAFNFVTGYVVSDLTGDDVTDGSDGAVADNNAFNFVGVARP